ncbi:bifunctional allantoicase/(S)-ureidoglycine aminohydrolase [Defluviimonas sp. WL0002]|uniref:Bifunctional allantoicase/(S)-ureidoglycine aminohydrolase n=1 Tax=Albidovulum marisflavi TaxID=2984159 RepID=A0ABT2ZE43_9RHOB|nr:bifunctional allantoicase/(S)-ureidoglycine aminohydrolase [Defluviimonas sp. WL0002]MCV2869413.1 bifunctional allantoicase/(S)-ureidoglycine aminohydrolase [Defluviimonas sp. WL0002]
MTAPYFAPTGGLPPQTALMTGRAVFTEAYCFIPKGCFSDIVTSYLPGWTGTRMWLIARPMSGFSETFSQYVMEVAPGGGADAPENEPGAQSVIFVTRGTATLSLDGKDHVLEAGGYAYLPPGCAWRLWNRSDDTAHFHWVRKLYEPAAGIPTPDAFVTSDREVEPIAMPDTQGRWATTRFADPSDLRHDMHVNIVTFQPGGLIPFEETHVMEHGLYVLEGKAVYKLNRDWVEVEAGDFMWLRAYCPQACYAAGPGPFRYLLYKDVNRHARLRGPGAFGR